MVVVVVLPKVIILPWVRVKVQLPDGRELNTTLPVATVQVGCVGVPVCGAVGVTGCEFMTALRDAGDVQLVEFDTVKVYEPGVIPEIIVLVPVPEFVNPPGVRVIVQVPVAGKPLKVTLPVATEQVGWVGTPTIGAERVEGCGGIITSSDHDKATHPAPLVTKKLYVPGRSPEMVVLTVVPIVITLPGFRLSIHVPGVGKPLSTTLPVGEIQVGYV
jgi:hypothetical protein